MAALWLYIMHGNNTGGALSWRELNLKRYISTPARRVIGAALCQGHNAPSTQQGVRVAGQAEFAC